MGFRMSSRTYDRPNYRYAPAPAYESPTFPRTSPQQTRRRLMAPQVDPSVPSAITTPEQLEQMQQQRRRPSYAGDGPNEPRVRYVGPQPTAPGGSRPSSPGSSGGKR
jgi:hypothetical protein